MREAKKPEGRKTIFKLELGVRRALQAPPWASSEPWYGPLSHVVPHLPVFLVPRSHKHVADAGAVALSFARLWEHLGNCALSRQTPNRTLVRQGLTEVLKAIQGRRVLVQPEQRADLVERSLRLANDALHCPDWHHTPWAQELLALTRKGIALNNGNGKRWREVEEMLRAPQYPDTNRMCAILNEIARAMDHGHVEVFPHDHTAMFIKGVRAARTQIKAA